MLSTIRAKLLGGFIVITLMVIGLAVYSVVKVEQSAGGFSDYRKMARDVSVAGSLQAHMLVTRIGVVKYLGEPTNEAVVQFASDYKNTHEDVLLAKANELAKQQNKEANFVEAIIEIENSLTQYKSHFDAVVNLDKQYDEIFSRTLQNNGRLVEGTLTELSRTSQNVSVVKASSEALRSLLLARIYTLTYLDSNTPESLTRATTELRDVAQQVNVIKNNLTDPDTVERFARAVELIVDYEDGLSQIAGIFQSRNKHIDSMNSFGGKVADITEQARLTMRAEQDKIGPAVQALNQDIIKMMTIIGLLVTILVIVLAILIPRIITRGLSSIQNKLGQISQTGDFAIRADDNRKDEIGLMGKAVNQMLSNMQGAISEANAVVSALAAGQFDKRVTKTLSGDLNTLKTGINNSADNIADVMNQLKQAMQYLRDGHFDVELSTQAQGEYRSMIETAANSMADMNRVITEINAVMTKVSDGAFNERVRGQAAGDMDALKTAINTTVEVLENVIGDITRVMDAQSQGDLTLAVTTDCNGQLNQLKLSINKNAENLSGIISSALSNASIVSTASDEVSRGSLDLSQRVQEQAAALEETSATMDQMNSAVQNNTQNSLEATRVARDVQTKAHEGTDVMQQTIEAMNAIQQSSHQIADIVNLIDSIAFQTNLLALNAAVEAARAGDQGRGFAVVAGEVRSLAQKSAEAAKDIKLLIDESVARIDQGTKLASASGEVLKEINGAVENVTNMIEHIAQASREQSEGISQVHKAIADIDQVTQQNAALVEETSAAAESLSEQATDLSRNMAFFKTANSHQQPGLVNKPRVESKRSNTTGRAPKATALAVSHKATAKVVAKKNNPDEWGEF